MWLLGDSLFSSTRSPTSPMMTFHREGFGRQSMSEKRKGHMDPRTSEVYQRAKASKDQKDNKGKVQLFCLFYQNMYSWGCLLNMYSRNCVSSQVDISKTVSVLFQNCQFFMKLLFVEFFFYISFMIHTVGKIKKNKIKCGHVVFFKEKACIFQIAFFKAFVSTCLLWLQSDCMLISGGLWLRCQSFVY